MCMFRSFSLLLFIAVASAPQDSRKHTYECDHKSVQIVKTVNTFASEEFVEWFRRLLYLHAGQ